MTHDTGRVAVQVTLVTMEDQFATLIGNAVVPLRWLVEVLLAEVLEVDGIPCAPE